MYKGRPNQSVAFHPKQALLPFTELSDGAFSSLSLSPRLVFWFIGMPPIFVFSFGANGKGGIVAFVGKFYQRSWLKIEPLGQR